MEQSKKIPATLEQNVELLKACYRPEKIILFGSWAYGVPSEESDVDVLIIKRTDQPFHKRWAEVYRIVSPLGRGVDFSPFVMTPEEVLSRQRARDPFIEEILMRGKTLYAA